MLKKFEVHWVIPSILFLGDWIGFSKMAFLVELGLLSPILWSLWGECNNRIFKDCVESSEASYTRIFVKSASRVVEFKNISMIDILCVWK